MWLTFANSKSVVLQIDGATPFLVDPKTTDYSASGLGTPLDCRVASYDHLMYLPSYPFPHPPAPIPTNPLLSPPPSSPNPALQSCDYCVSDGVIDNPFCVSSICDIGTIESVIRLIRSMLFPVSSVHQLESTVMYKAKKCL